MIESAQPESLATQRRHLSWFLLLRLIVATLFLGGTIVYQRQADTSIGVEGPFLYGMVALTYLQTALSAWILPRSNRLQLFAQTQIVWDLLLAISLIYLTGAFSSHFSFLFILIIFSASLFLRRRHVLFTASAAAILYGSLLDLQYFNQLPLLAGVVYPSTLDGAEVLYAVLLNVSAFILTGLLSSALAERRWTSEHALQRTEIDLDELESLNRAMLANITSGLMLVNPQGRIRSFNAAATHITGLTLADVYDRPVWDLFPCFDIASGEDLNEIVRGEGLYHLASGQPLPMGFSTTRVYDVAGDLLGLLIVFQDLTELQALEQQLRRADRLAAVGRLASAMAHEIRNPLASISGSVQLLLEGGSVSADDRRLMGIVVHEADRLSRLLTDFLAFARPPQPEPTSFLLSEFLDELVVMLRGDRRFTAIKILREDPSGATCYADRGLLRQVLWSLAINAVEAMQGKGVLYLGCEPDVGLLYVEDSGPGVPAEVMGKIFEPFFTTKDIGTGLGLATVYSIVEAHGGMIDVSEGRSGGARFTFSLPQHSPGGFAVFAAHDPREVAGSVPEVVS
jgi:two-component system sensor histidine kinase PilS (NtrC family)